ADISAIQKFDDLPLSSSVKQAIVQTLPPNAKPSEIQALAIPILLDAQKQHVLIAAETGSGKTFAYLLPTIEKLKKNETIRRPNRPRAVILVPTRELIDQVVKSAKSLSHVVKFRALGYDRRRLLDELPIDILVTTPTSLITSIKASQLALTDTQFLVIDEADSMFDSGWGDDCRWILKRASESHVTIVSATLPRSVQRVLDDLFPKMTKITTPSLHKSLPNLKQSFVDLDRFQGNRQLALLEILKKNIKDKKTLVFCNTRKSAELLQKFMESKGLSTLAIYKDAPTDRSETLSLFSESQKPEHKMLISTDIASRGIDIHLVEHVILFDFPTSAIDYLHRVGRTARAGNSGKATSLIGRKDR
ncbi:P-loop containing nucleoside triphosphate hydrolase protein, partial [Sporodiniella umbellata]